MIEKTLKIKLQVLLKDWDYRNYISDCKISMKIQKRDIFLFMQKKKKNYIS